MQKNDNVDIQSMSKSMVGTRIWVKLGLVLTAKVRIMVTVRFRVSLVLPFLHFHIL